MENIENCHILCGFGANTKTVDMNGYDFDSRCEKIRKKYCIELLSSIEIKGGVCSIKVINSEIILNKNSYEKITLAYNSVVQDHEI